MRNKIVMYLSLSMLMSATAVQALRYGEKAPDPGSAGDPVRKVTVTQKSGTVTLVFQVDNVDKYTTSQIFSAAFQLTDQSPPLTVAVKKVDEDLSEVRISAPENQIHTGTLTLKYGDFPKAKPGEEREMGGTIQGIILKVSNYYPDAEKK